MLKILGRCFTGKRKINVIGTDSEGSVTIDMNTVESSGDDSLTTGSGADTIKGGAGNDIINASGGDDSVLGGDGSDVIRGGKGTDILKGGFGSIHLYLKQLILKITSLMLSVICSRGKDWD